MWIHSSGFSGKEPHRVTSITLRRTLDEHDTEGLLDHCAPSGAGGVQDGAVGRATLSPHDFVAQRWCAVVVLRTARNVVNSPPAHPVFEFSFLKKNVSLSRRLRDVPTAAEATGHS